MKNDLADDHPLVSIIVPTRNSAETLLACLGSARSQSYPLLEIIVVDNCSSDNTKQIASTHADMVLEKGPERSAQRNFGATKSNGDFLLIVDSDMEISEDVIAESLALLNYEDNVRALIIPEKSFGSGFWARCKALERSFYIGVDWMEAARFFEKAVFEEMGGYCEELTGMEDYDLPQRIEAKYGRDSVGRIKAPIWHNESNLSLVGSCKKKFYYVKNSSSYALKDANSERFSQQSSIKERFKIFLSKPGRLFRDPFLGIGMLFMKFCEFSAGGLGYLAGRLGGPSGLRKGPSRRLY